MTINENFEEAFNEWWEPDPDEGYTDLPYPDIDKEKQRAIFLAGYLWGSRKPVYQMSVTQYTAIVKAIEGKIRDERWVGLTYEDQKAIADIAGAEDWHDYQVMDAIEAKLKEKNT